MTGCDCRVTVHLCVSWLHANILVSHNILVSEWPFVYLVTFSPFSPNKTDIDLAASVLLALIMKIAFLVPVSWTKVHFCPVRILIIFFMLVIKQRLNHSNLFSLASIVRLNEVVLYYPTVIYCLTLVILSIPKAASIYITISFSPVWSALSKWII